MYLILCEHVHVNISGLLYCRIVVAVLKTEKRCVYFFHFWKQSLKTALGFAYVRAHLGKSRRLALYLVSV